MKKIVMLILVCAMVCSLAACGEKPAEPAPATAAPTQAANTAPEQAPVLAEKVDAGVDPTLINFGTSGGETHLGDNWYKDGAKDADYIYFETADNANAGFACVKVEGGNVAKTWLCKVGSDDHVVDQDGSSDLDLVFESELSVYNNADGVRYIRGNAEELAKLFADKTLTEKDNPSNTIVLNADGTGKEVFDGKEDALTWEVITATIVSVSDSEYEYKFTVNTDDAGNFVSLTEQNFRCFLPNA